MHPRHGYGNIKNASENIVHGPIAQLGERLVRIQEVRGSSPLRSTSKIKASGNRKPFLFSSFTLTLPLPRKKTCVKQVFVLLFGGCCLLLPQPVALTFR